MKATRTCSIDECDQAAYRKGWCAGHYGFWRRNGDPLLRKRGLPDSQCIAPGCSRMSKYRGKHLCQLHYFRLRDFGSFDLPQPPSDREVILARVSISDTECWEWQGAISSRGYGRLRGADYSHRVAYEAFVGPIPQGLEIDHLCRNPRCCNPAHLEPVTPRENLRRQAAAVTHCIHGHEFTEENTYWRPDGGGRQCRVCIRNRTSATPAERP